MRSKVELQIVSGAIKQLEVQFKFVINQTLYSSSLAKLIALVNARRFSRFENHREIKQTSDSKQITSLKSTNR